MSEIPYKPLRARVVAQLKNVATDLEVRQRAPESDAHRLAYSAALMSVRCCMGAVQRAKSADRVEEHLFTLRGSLEQMEIMLQEHFGVANDCITRAKRIHIH